MNVLDIGVILILLMFAIVGFKQGVIRELIAFIGIVLIFYLAYALCGVVGDILCLTLQFFDFKGSIMGMSAINLLLYQALAFILIFAILLSLYEIILKLSKVLQKIVNLTIILWLPSKLLGAVVGLLKGYIVLFLLLVVLFIPLGSTGMYENSRFASKIVYNTPILSNSIGSITKSTKEVYVLVSKVAKKKVNANEANLETIDILLKHKVVKKETIRKLIEKNKLTDVKGIDKILNKY